MPSSKLRARRLAPWARETPMASSTTADTQRHRITHYENGSRSARSALVGLRLSARPLRGLVSTLRAFSRPSLVSTPLFGSASGGLSAFGGALRRFDASGRGPAYM